MTDRVFNPEETIKLKHLVDSGIAVMTEIDTLSGGLNDTIKALAEEMEIKSSILKKAVRIAHKASLGTTNQDHEALNTVLETVGRVL